MFLRFVIITSLLLAFTTVKSQPAIEELMPVRGFSIAAPATQSVDQFVTFIEDELAARSINVLILRVDYNYQYKSHPELKDSVALSEKDVKKLVAVCQQHGIRIVPQINLLGHQSWAEGIGNLLKVYPEFDETPSVKMPEKYEWPNEDGLYCKSYCPLHPGVHEIVFALVDELLDVFEASDFHAGLDEVFYIGEDECPRCSGHDKARLFADEVWRIRNHLAEKNRKLWMWGDRLIDGKTTGLGMWEASMNNTHRAIDMIPKDVFICDWHYERPDKTAVYFAMKGFEVATCPWRNHDVARVQVQDMIGFRSGSTPKMKENFQGIILTSWSSAESFMKNYYVESKEGGAREMLSIFELQP
ncbi:MAG: family 20 glycosylhydrolase [Bacteroidales bacterium]|nr:family 20 glycosylhydrolase [Bacteroidales bacterium]